MSSPPVIIFNGRLLPSSETFIKAQAEGLQQFTPYFVGARLVDGLPLPPERTIVVNSDKPLGKIEEVLFKQTGFAPYIYQKLRTLQPKLIHAHFGVCGALALPIAKAIDVPLIVTFHGFDASMTDEYARRNSISTRVYLQRRERLKRETHLFIAVSNFIRKRLVKQGFPEDKIQVHYIGIDTERFQPDPSVSRQRKVLFVGRLVEKKGCEYLIRAMAKIQMTEPEVELIIIGDGPLRPKLETLASRCLNHYSFLGLQSQDVVKLWMNRSKVFCVPSIETDAGDAEGFGIVFAEAQAMGLPVVSSMSGGIPEAVAHKETGFLVPERDWEAIAENILQLLQNSSLWTQFSLQGRTRIQSNFDLHKQIQLLENMYQDVSQQRQCSPS